MIDLSDKTMASLLASMLLRVTEEVNKREGSLIRTALSAAAWAIEGVYIELADVQRSAFGTTATGEYLDLKAEERGLTRLPATNAVSQILADIGELPLGFQFADESSNTWTITTAALSGPDDDGLYTYNAMCETSGEIPEPSGSLRSLEFYAGLTEAHFGDVVVAGENEESDADFRKRYLESLVEISFAGNISAYREKILETTFEVTGGTARVGALQVYPTTALDGTEQSGHVKIYIVDSNLQPASQNLIDAVQAFICPMYNGVAIADGFGFAPIGAAVHICGTDVTPSVKISIMVSLSTGATVESVTPAIQANVRTYIQRQKSNWGSQITYREENAILSISEAFVYAASIVQGVRDVTSVVFYKDSVIVQNPLSLITSPSQMEWIDDNELEIEVLSN